MLPVKVKFYFFIKRHCEFEFSHSKLHETIKSERCLKCLTCCLSQCFYADMNPPKNVSHYVENKLKLAESIKNSCSKKKNL